MISLSTSPNGLSIERVLFIKGLSESIEVLAFKHETSQEPNAEQILKSSEITEILESLEFWKNEELIWKGTPNGDFSKRQVGLCNKEIEDYLK